MRLSFIYLLLLATFCDSYKILIYSPKFGTSHVNFMGKLADLLVEAGHDVVVYVPQVLDDVLTNGTKLARLVPRHRDFDAPATTHEGFQPGMWSGNNEGYLNMRKIFYFISTSHGNLCKAQFQDQPIMNQLKSEKFDIALGENFDLCYYGILKRLGIENFITVFSTPIYEYGPMVLGVPSTPSFVPGLFNGLKPPFSYFERATNLMAHIFSWMVLPKNMGGPANNFLKGIYGKDFDAMTEMAKSTYFFVNADEHVDFPRPISHKIIYVGGVGKVQSKPLDKKFEEIMQKSKRGVVLVSFGSVAKSSAMPPETKKVILETFANFPDVTFLWKYENVTHKVAEGHENVITEKWVPQNDLLDHPKLLAFVSHGGMNSVQEGATKGVPMIMIPLFHDQMRNSQSLAYRKMALVLEKRSLTVEKFTAALKEIIENDSYRKNAKRLSEMIRDKPESAENRVVKYTEFAARYGPNLNLNMEGRNLSFIQFYCLDVIVPVLIAVVLVVYVVFKVFLYILRRLINLLNGSKSKLE